jgi:arsenate reductase (thioredoxin)
MKTHPTRLLFLCTGNSCRSQIAEGWAKKLGGDRFQVKSAGIESHGKNPLAIAVMQDVEVDISEQESNRLDQETLEWADLVVTVCEHADKNCPTLSQDTHKEHWLLSDPAKATGTEEEIIATFRSSRDDIQQRVSSLLERLETQPIKN